MFYLCGGAGGETQSSENAAAKIKPRTLMPPMIFMMNPFYFFRQRMRLQAVKKQSPFLRVDKGFELSRGKKCRMPVRSSNATGRATLTRTAACR